MESVTAELKLLGSGSPPRPWRLPCRPGFHPLYGGRILPVLEGVCLTLDLPLQGRLGTLTLLLSPFTEEASVSPADPLLWVEIEMATHSVFWPGESRDGSLVGCRARESHRSDTTATT